MLFLFILVPRTGFEPVTLSLEVSCSIHLSYRGILASSYHICPCLSLGQSVWSIKRKSTVLHEDRAFLWCG